MKLLCYKGNSPNVSGLIDRLIRFRLNGKYSHTEIMFEPGDLVDSYLPDKSASPINGAYWCGSSSGIDILPKNSRYRAGYRGGVRFKRINPNPNKWDIINIPNKSAIESVKIFKDNEGFCYDYELVLGYINFLFRDTENKLMCSEICAMALGFQEPWRYDPCLLASTVKSNLHL